MGVSQKLIGLLFRKKSKSISSPLNRITFYDPPFLHFALRYLVEEKGKVIHLKYYKHMKRYAYYGHLGI